MTYRFPKVLLVFATGLLASIVSVSACGSDDPMITEDRARTAVVIDFVSITLPMTIADYRTASEGLRDASAAYANDPSDANRSAAQDAWRQAITAWQRIEPMLVGPLGEAGIVGGGQDLRADVYSWPSTNTCRIDQETLEDAHADPALLAEERVNVRGLDAIEYILFDADEENACSAISRINAEGEWEAERANIRSRRARYVATASELLVQNVATIETAMSEFATVISISPNEFFRSNQDALNSIVGAMNYLDRQVKDAKLEGIANLSEEENGPDTRESRFANISLSHIRANIEGFERVYRGMGDGSGFASLYENLGATEAAARMDDALAAAYAELDRLGDIDVPTSWEADENGLAPLHERVRAITTLFKTEFFAILNVQLPMEMPTDND